MGKVFNALKKADLEAVTQQEKPAVPAEDVVVSDSIEAVPEKPGAVESETVVQENAASQPVESEPVLSEPAEPESTAVPKPPESSESSNPRPRKAFSASIERGDWDERLIQASAAHGAVAESIRTLRTRILHPESGKPLRNILVTSASPGEGKSFICANLGLSFAQGVDNQCLLVDCDLRKPSLGKLFGLSNAKGLVDYLQDTEKLNNVLVEVGVDYLRILPAGPPPVNPAELLGSSTMKHLIEELGSRYDDRIVLFDSPPLYAATETSILAKHVDAVVLVVRAGGSRREYVQSLVEQIGKEKIIGVVFNAYTSTVLDYKLFGSYEYQYNSY